MCFFKKIEIDSFKKKKMIFLFYGGSFNYNEEFFFKIVKFVLVFLYIYFFSVVK